MGVSGSGLASNHVPVWRRVWVFFGAARRSGVASKGRRVHWAARFFLCLQKHYHFWLSVQVAAWGICFHWRVFKIYFSVRVGKRNIINKSCRSIGRGRKLKINTGIVTAGGLFYFFSEVILLVISVDRQPTNKKGGGSRPLAGTWGLVWQAGLCCRQADGALCRADSGCCAVSCSLRAQWVCRCGWQSECLVYSVTTALVKIHCAYMQLGPWLQKGHVHLCVLPGRAGTGAALPNRRCSVQAAHRPRLLPKPLISCFHSYLLWLLMFTVLSQT